MASRIHHLNHKRFSVERMAGDYLDLYRQLPGVRRDAARLRRVAGLPVDIHEVA